MTIYGELHNFQLMHQARTYQEASLLYYDFGRRYTNSQKNW